MIPVLTAFAGLVSTFIQGRQKVSEKKADAKAKQVEHQGTVDLAATKQMSSSWKDEYWLVVFSLPLISMFISPYIDAIHMLFTGAVYQPGMLLEASANALSNLDAAPMWYKVIIIMMVSVSYGYRKLINWYITRNN